MQVTNNIFIKAGIKNDKNHCRYDNVNKVTSNKGIEETKDDQRNDEKFDKSHPLNIRLI